MLDADAMQCKCTGLAAFAIKHQRLLIDALQPEALDCIYLGVFFFQFGTAALMAAD
jgi:hypothetical protein